MNIRQLQQSDNFQSFMKEVQKLYDAADEAFHGAKGEDLLTLKGKTAGLQAVLDLPDEILTDQESEDSQGERI